MMWYPVRKAEGREGGREDWRERERGSEREIYI